MNSFTILNGYFLAKIFRWKKKYPHRFTLCVAVNLETNIPSPPFLLTRDRNYLKTDQILAAIVDSVFSGI